jgi:hypothetical protein
MRSAWHFVQDDRILGWNRPLLVLGILPLVLARMVPQRDTLLQNKISQNAPSILQANCLEKNLANVHICCCSSFAGNLCIDIPSIWYVFVQLHNPGPGPPQMQY